MPARPRPKKVRKSPRRPAQRAPTPSRIVRDVRYELRLSDRESEMLQEIMDAEGLPASELVRRWLHGAHGVRK